MRRKNLVSSDAPAGFDPGIVFIIVANLVPVVSFFLFHLQVAEFFFIYWSESIIIGFFAALKIIIGDGSAPWKFRWFLPLLGFSAFYYCIMYACLLIIWVIFFFHDPGTALGNDMFSFRTVIESIISLGIIFPLFFLRDAFSFSQYLASRRFEKANQNAIPLQPLRRIIPLYFVLILGCFLAFLPVPWVVVILFFAVKVVIEVSIALYENDPRHDYVLPEWLMRFIPKDMRWPFLRA